MLTAMARPALVIMARYPEIGQVKTRLGQAIGSERACELYRAFLTDLDARFANRTRQLVWAYHPPDHDFAALVASGSRCEPQVGSSLADRMYNCFRQLCREFDRVIMIGADVPHVRDEWLDEAERALDDADIVLGPSHDGGYYLIAMRQPHDVFSGIATSTPNVLTDTRRVAAARGLRERLLPSTFDVDGVEDLQQLRMLLQTDEAMRLPATAALIKSWSAT